MDFRNGILLIPSTNEIINSVTAQLTCKELNRPSLRTESYLPRGGPPLDPRREPPAPCRGLPAAPGKTPGMPDAMWPRAV